MNWKLVVLWIGITGVFGSAAYAQTSSSAVAQVRVQILPKVSVSAMTPVVDLGALRTGTIGANFVYHVEANSSEVAIFVEASDLHRMQDPGKRVDPIPLSQSAGVRIQQGTATSWHAGNDRLSISSTAGSVIDGLPTHKSDVGHLSSSRSVFNDNVTVHVSWDQKDPDKTPGEYGGVVRLTTTTTDLPN